MVVGTGAGRGGGAVVVIGGGGAGVGAGTEGVFFLLFFFLLRLLGSVAGDKPMEFAPFPAECRCQMRDNASWTPQTSIRVVPIHFLKSVIPFFL